jgi:AAA family ATPase
MDGFETSHNVLVLAATNRPQALDSALLRAGRFDGLIYVGPPDAAARDTILRRQLAARRMAPDVDVTKLVQRTEGFSGAELTNVCEAAGQIAFERELRRRRTGTGEMAWISEDDLTRAVEQQPKLITAQMLAQYQAWEKKLRDH